MKVGRGHAYRIRKERIITSVVTWGVALASLVGILVRPKRSPEWAWALGGAAVLVAIGSVSVPAAWHAVARGTDVYLFLVGMLVLAELARASGVFDWLATLAVRAAEGSATRFFAIVFGVGVVVTAVLSNDATAVVLTPAVAAAARKARTAPLPHLYACAFVANAGSFVLPISNPANLVIFGGAMPPLPTWLATFALPSFGALLLTFVALRIVWRRDLAASVATDLAPVALSLAGKTSLGAIVLAAIALGLASSRGLPLGAVTAACAAIAFVVAVGVERKLAGIVRQVSWGVIALVAGLFVLVAGIDATGVLASARAAVVALSGAPPWQAIAVAGTTTALVSNVTNNLPSGLLSGLALAGAPHPIALAAATAIGIDLGPNLSVTGSLATILWLIALRRDEIAVGPWTFLRIGAVVMPPALFAALGLLALLVR